MPEISSPAKIAKIREFGADVVVKGARYNDALELCEAYQKESGAYGVHAFDAWPTIEGQGTMGDAVRMKVPAPLWRVMQGLRHSEAGNFVHAARNQLLLVGLRPGGTIGIDVTGRAGVGANLTHLLMGLAVCEARGLKPAIRITNPLYRREGEREWFANFFEPVAPPTALPRRWLHLQKDADHEVIGSPADLSLADGKALFDRHVRVRPFLNEKVDALLDGYRTPFGVHYRGTDKGSEAPQVQQRAAVAAVRRALADRHDVIFLATDEPAFADALRAAVTDRPIVMYEPEGLVPEPGVAVLWWN